MKKTTTFSITALFILVATFVELSFQTSQINKFGVYWSPTIWLLGGLLCCFFASFHLPTKEIQGTTKQDKASLFIHWFLPAQWMRLVLFWASFLLATLFIGDKLADVFIEHPIDPLLSDVIPSMQLYVKRFLAGEKVYTEMFFPRWSFFPTYLPFMWAPYIPAEIFQIDYRWTAYLFFMLALVFWNRRLLSKSIYFEEALLKMLIPFLMLGYFILYNESTLGFAIELTAVSYYLMLAFSLGSKRLWVIAIPIICCLLSRYAFSFWLPVYVLILWAEYGFKRAFQVGFLVVVGLVLFYVIPFLSQDWQLLSKGAEAYNNAILGQWKIQTWQAPGALPHHLNQGLSYSIFFYLEFPELAVTERLKLNKIVHLAISLGSSLFILAAYFFMRKKWPNFNFKLFSLVSLKLYLVIFYSLLYVPFSYLYQLPLFLSIPIIYETVILNPSRKTTS